MDRSDSEADALRADQRAIAESLDQVARSMAAMSHQREATVAGAGLPPGANLAAHFNRSRNATALVALLAGILLAVVAIPERASDQMVTGAQGAVAGTGSASGGLGAGPGDGSGAVAEGGAAGVGGTADATGGAGGPGAAAGPAGAGGAGGAGGAAVAGGTDPAAVASGPVQGVTDDTIKVGFIDLDSSDLASICPRCGNGEATKGGATQGLIKAWLRDGKLPVHGRTIEPVFRRVGVLATEQRRAACVDMAQRVKPFVVVPVWIGPDVTECLAREFGMLTVDGQLGGDEQLLARSPNMYFVGFPAERMIRNYVHWAHEKGLFKGQTLGLYTVNVPSIQETLNRSLRPELKRLGYELKVDMARQGDQTDAVAVQRFQSAGVTTVIFGLAVSLSDIAGAVGYIGASQGFQAQAEAQGYRPKYPIWDFGVAMEDAVADILWKPEQMDGNFAFSPAWYDFAQRRPATPRNNETAKYCYKSYQEFTGKPLDTYDNTAEVQYVNGACAVVEVLRQAFDNAGPNLTKETFVAGLNEISGFETTRYPSVTFGPNRRAGADMWTTFQFRKDRWPDTNLVWGPVEGFRPFWDQR